MEKDDFRQDVQQVAKTIEIFKKQAKKSKLIIRFNKILTGN